MTKEIYLKNKRDEIAKYVSTFKLHDVNFVGIDRSLTCTGIAIVNKGNLVYQAEVKVKEFDIERLIAISKEVIRHIKPYKNTVICMEGYSFGSKFSQAHSLGELGGTLKMVFKLKGIQYLETEPTTLKKYISGKGNRPKDLIPMDVFKKFGVEPLSGDRADAIGCAFFIYNAFKYRNMNNAAFLQYEEEAFETFFHGKAKKKKTSRKKKNEQLAADIQE